MGGHRSCPYHLWMKMYHPHIEASGDGPSSFQDSFIHTPVKKVQQRATVAMLARPHSTIQHMLWCPPPTSLPSLMPRQAVMCLPVQKTLRTLMVNKRRRMRKHEAS